MRTTWSDDHSCEQTSAPLGGYSIGSLWHEWGQVAVRSERDAWTHRRLLISGYEAGGANNIHPAWNDELVASMVAVAASAHALDAMYGQLVNEDVRRMARLGDDAGREAHIRACLSRRFKIDNATGKRWAGEFRWLFDLRDAAVHAHAQPRAHALHPSGIRVYGSTLEVDYCAESAARAVDLLLAVLTHATSAPRTTDPGAFRWADLSRNAVHALVERREAPEDA